ncbi:MAG: ferrous iron transport protein B [Candidatus Methanomethylophilaceae archaeon]
MRIALAGNPNSGKTTVFNKLTGSSQRVGNWPGVTIDRKEGRIKGIADAVLVDLPGIYSLSPYSPEEVISGDYLLKERPDVILNIVDASNLERNLYLTVQLMETCIPMVIALNMTDVAESNGCRIDPEALERELGCKVVRTVASTGKGMAEIKAALASPGDVPKCMSFSDDMESVLERISSVIPDDVPEAQRRWTALKMLESGMPDSEISEDIAALEKKYDDTIDGVMISQRYDRVCAIASAVTVNEKSEKRKTLTEKLDSLAVGRITGLPIFVCVMAVVYGLAMLEGSPGQYATGWLNDYIGETFTPWFSDALVSAGVEMPLLGLIVDGIVAGVGAVIGFLPQMIVLFVLLVILEESGYMSRVAFVMDRVFRRFGLSGKSFIPLLVGTGCGVPGIMSSRTIEGEMERKITSMTVTFMPCSAKLPVIALITGALFGGSAWVALGCYFGGIVAVLMSGIILKKFGKFSGTPAPFIMELPPYHIPSLRSVVTSTVQRAWSFVKKAFTLILLATILVWFLSTYDWQLNEVASTDASMLASIGNAICWIFAPLGFGNWELTTATFTGLIAKENLVGTLGVISGFEDDEAGLFGWLSSILTSSGAIGLLAFNMLCAPCFAAIGAMHRELGDWKSTGFAVAYQCGFAYACSLILVQFGGLILGEEINMAFMFLAVVAAALLAYLLVSGSRTPQTSDGRCGA